MATAEDLLKKYGYTEVAPGLFIPARPSSERWEKVDGGWHCFALATSGFGGGEPWGRVATEPTSWSSGLMQVPFSQTEAFALASGLHPARQPEAFEWVWPEKRLIEIYAHTAGPDGNEWVKTDEGVLVKEKS